MGHRSGDPFGRSRFLVDLGDGSGDLAAGAFRKVTGLGTWIDPVVYRTGSDPDGTVRTLPGRRHYGNVTLRRGLIGDLRLWAWIDATPPDRRTVVITLHDEQRTAVLRFVLHEAWPCRWTGPTLSAKSSDLAIEELELCHERLEIRSA